MASAVDQLMKASRVILLGDVNRLARRQRDAISQRAVEGLRASVLNFRRVRHAADDLRASADRRVLLRFDLRKLVENRLRQFALFEIENAIVSEQKTPTVLLFVFLGTSSSVPCLASSTFQKTTTVLSSPLRTWPPSWFAWRIVNQNGDTYFDAESRK